MIELAHEFVMKIDFWVCLLLKACKVLPV